VGKLESFGLFKRHELERAKDGGLTFVVTLRADDVGVAAESVSLSLSKTRALQKQGDLPKVKCIQYLSSQCVQHRDAWQSLEHLVDDRIDRMVVRDGLDWVHLALQLFSCSQSLGRPEHVSSFSTRLVQQLGSALTIAQRSC
jgi:hypothetical protein